MTLHKWAGIGLGNEGIKVGLGRAFSKKKEYKQTRVLIIDEISMVRQYFLVHFFDWQPLSSSRG
jgi:ATP-dependent exoDNAse (exonuclease V) alpha subunit